MRLSSKRSVVLGGVVLGAGLVSFVVPAAQAAVIVNSRYSEVSAYAGVQSTFPGSEPVEDRRTRTATDTGAFIQRVTASAMITTATADSEARQSSHLTFNGGTDFTGATASGESYVFVAPTNDFALAQSLSEFVVRFTVPTGEQYNYAYTGNLTNDSGRTSVYVDVARVLGDEEYDVLFSRSGDAGAFTTSGTLAAGTYEVYASSFGRAIEDPAGGGTANYTLDFSLTPVPEPATGAIAAALLALPLAGRGRRRR